VRVTIVGAGAVGFNLASTLSGEGHDVSVVELRPEPLAKVRDRLDVSAVEGSGTNAATLLEAGVKEADLFIAVTEVDEVNMVACALAHALGPGRRIARVRNRDFAGRDSIVPKRTFGISRIINQDEVTVAALVQAITDPGVTDTAEFADGEILLRGTVLAEDSPFLNVRLVDLRHRFPDIPFLIAAVDRDEEITIPDGDTVLQARDRIFVILRRDGLPEFRRQVQGKRAKVQRVVIYGASRVGRELARKLEPRVENVVLIEKDPLRAQAAAAELDRTLVLKGAITDPSIRDDAHLAGADYLVATSQVDEMNLVAAAICHRLPNGPRIGVVTSDADFVPALNALELDLVINERLITVEAILRFVRPGRYLSVKRLNEAGAEIMEVSVQRGARADGRALKDLGLPTGALVVAVNREGQAILPSGSTVILHGDTVVLVALPAARETAARMFFHKRWVSLQEQSHRR